METTAARQASTCACGVTTPPQLRHGTRPDNGEEFFAYSCPECGIDAPMAKDAETALSYWEELTAEIKAAHPEKCCRCGVPIWPDGFIHPGTDQPYCQICAEDMFGI